jgi:hypothetical protein
MDSITPNLWTRSEAMEREQLAITRSSFRASTSGTPYTEAISDGLQLPTSKQTVQDQYNTSAR